MQWTGPHDAGDEPVRISQRAVLQRAVPRPAVSPRAVPPLAAACALVAIATGCGTPPPPPPPAPSAEVRVTPVVSEEVREQLLDGAVSVLSCLDDYDEDSAFAQVFDRLNQWSHGGGGGRSEWRIDPLFARLPARLRAGVPEESLASSVFDATADVQSLRDQRWLADIAASARGEALEDLDVAVNLFRWTVRSLALVSDPPLVPVEGNPGTRWFLPGEILLSGRASAAQRAWIFLQLLRHAGLDGVMLATGDPAAGTQRAWIPALVAGGEAWLFEPAYGMPIAGPDGTGVATARQAAADPTVLGRLSLPDRPYPVSADDVAGLSVLVAGDPWTLSRRMLDIDRQLAGARAMRLALDASAVARRGAAALPAAGGAESVAIGLWEFPFEVLAQRRADMPRVQPALARELGVMTLAIAEPSGQGRAPRMVRPLYVARLREFRGDLDGADGAKLAYLQARPGRQAIAEAVRALPPDRADGAKRLFEQMKEDATYWLGILTLGEGEFATAADYLGRMTLEAAPDSRWADAARVNLARALVALGRTGEASRLLREDASPQRFGSRLLADELEKSPRP